MPRLDPSETDITIELDGEPVAARSGEPVACSLLAAGHTLFARSVKYHRPRGPYCFAAACSSCLMRVDGVPNIFTCRVPAQEGMRLERQNAYPSASLDMFAANDLIFFKGFNHHTMFAGVPIAQDVMLAVARKLAGLGTLPDAAAPERPEAEVQHVDVAIVGAGVSGLAASAELTRRGVSHVVFEREVFAGGRAAYGVPEADVTELPLPTPSVLLGHTVVALYDDEEGRFLAVLTEDRLMKVYAKKFLIALGGHPALPAFANNDLPGIYAARALSRLIRRYRISPGARVAVAGDTVEAERLAALLKRSGCTPVAVGAEPIAAHGLNVVNALTVRQAGNEEKVDCDAVAICGPTSPAFELARQGGARVVFDGTRFVVESDADGRTAQSTVFVAGEQRGPCTLSASADSGRRAAVALVETAS